MKVLQSTFIILLLILILPAVTSAQSNWKALKTEYFTVFYQDGQEETAWQVLKVLEYYRPQLENLCGNSLFHLPVVIRDIRSSSSGYADISGFSLHLFKTPQPTAEVTIENWWSFITAHEYTHQLTLSQTGGVDRFLTNTFGNPLSPSIAIFMPNSVAPNWIGEGMAVYSESRLSPYQGELNDGSSDAYIGALASTGKIPSILDATYAPLQFQMRGSYTFGGAFFNYLAQTYGEDKLAQFFEINGTTASFIPFPSLGIDSSAKKVFGLSFPELWRQWASYEAERFKDFKMEGERLTNHGWYILSPIISQGRLYYQRAYSVKTGAFKSADFTEIVERDLQSNKERILISNPGLYQPLPLRIKNNQIFYTVMETKPSYQNASLRSPGYYFQLWRYDLKSGERKLLIDQEIRSFDVLSDGKILFSKELSSGFGSEIYRFDPVTKESQLLFQTGYLIDELVSDEKRIVVSARKDWENLSLFSLNIETGEFTPLVDTLYAESGISLQGERLFFTANYQKTISAYCFDFSAAKISRLTETGFASHPVCDENSNQLYFIGMTADGYDIYRKTVQLNEFQLPEDPATVPPVFTLDENQVIKGGYGDNLTTLVPRFWLPLININNDTSQYGLIIQGGDALKDFPVYQAGFIYDTKQQRLISSANLAINYFEPLIVSINYSNQDTGSLQLQAAYPLISKFSGLTNLTAGATVTYRNDFEGPEYEPFIETGFRFSKTNGDLKVSMPVEKMMNGNERTGLYSLFTINQYLPDSELSFKVLNINDPDNANSVFTAIRGYDRELTAKQGNIYSLEYSRPLFKINNGFWNPNLYFEDVTGILFMDRALGEKNEEQFSWGLELHLETSVYYHIGFDWGIRLVNNIENNSQVNIFVNIANLR